MSSDSNSSSDSFRGSYQYSYILESKKDNDLITKKLLLEGVHYGNFYLVTKFSDPISYSGKDNYRTYLTISFPVETSPCPLLIESILNQCFKQLPWKKDIYRPFDRLDKNNYKTIAKPASVRSILKQSI